MITTVWICWLFSDCSGVIVSWIPVPNPGIWRDHVLSVGWDILIFSQIGREGELVQWWSGERELH